MLVSQGRWVYPNCGDSDIPGDIYKCPSCGSAKRGGLRLQHKNIGKSNKSKNKRFLTGSIRAQNHSLEYVPPLSQVFTALAVLEFIGAFIVAIVLAKGHRDFKFFMFIGYFAGICIPGFFLLAISNIIKYLDSIAVSLLKLKIVLDKEETEDDK